jgi:hypothetical protein
MSRVFSGLWKHPDFLKLWLGQAVSEFGSHISREAIPILAATPAQMGLLVTAASVPVLVLGLFAGVWVDPPPHSDFYRSGAAGRCDHNDEHPYPVLQSGVRTCLRRPV